MPYEAWLEQRRIRPHELKPGELTRRIGELWGNYGAEMADGQAPGQSVGGRF